MLPWLGWGVAGPVLAAAPSVADTARQVDQLLQREIGTASQPAVARCDDETYLRRVFLDLLGRPPSQDDILAFCLDPDPAKRAQVVDRLLADREFGENWGRYWRDVVLFRRTEDRALIVANSFAEFLTEQLNANRPWSEIARQMITASGDARENGATGLIVAQAGMPEDVTAEVSRIFLGVQIQCAQCHDHPTDRWKREEFHQLAAFFPRIGVRLNMEDRSLVVTTTDFELRRRPNNNNRIFGTLEHHMPDKDDPAAKGTAMQPVFFLTGQQLAAGAKDAQRRGTLANWVTAPENRWFAKAYVNRIWAELIGRGFYEPIDDLGPDRECTAPQTMEFLAQTFATGGYDVKEFFRLVLATEAYQRESRSRVVTEAAPFAANCSQRLRGDQLYDSLVSVLNLRGRIPEPPPAAGYPNFRRDPRFLFNQVFGYDPSEPREEVTASIPQALLLMNSSLVAQGISAARPDALGGVLARNRDNQGALVEVYLNTLGRGPTERELQVCLAYVKKVNDRQEAFEDILWSLINSTEFTFRK